MNEYPLIELDLIAVKGKKEPVKIYTVAPNDDAMAWLLHEKFLDAYREGMWVGARFYAEELRDKGWNGEMHKYYEMMLERMQGDVPLDWDGIYRAKNK
jgi:adenylate cyclase